MIGLTILAAHAAPLPLAVEAVVFTSESESVRVASGEIVRRIEGELDHLGVAHAARPASYFEDEAPDAPLRLGARFLDVACLPQKRDRVRCQAKIEWELLHAPSGTVVYRTTLVTTGAGESTGESAIVAMLISVDRLVERVGFDQRLEASFYRPAVDPSAPRKCHAPDPVIAEIGTESSTVQAFAVDTRGAVLVIGSTADTLRLHVPARGPWLDATRVALVGEVGLYRLPIGQGLGCVGDDFVLPVGRPGAATVGEALATLGRPRSADPEPPVPIYDVGR